MAALAFLVVVAGAVIALAGATAIAQQSLEQQRALFETDARIVHRLLSQQMVQHNAILTTLALLQPSPSAPNTGSPEQRLPALYPRILSVQRSDAAAPWADPGLAEAERLSRLSARAALAPLDLQSGRCWLVLASRPASHAQTIDPQALVPRAEWPMAPETSAVQVKLVHAGQRHFVQPGRLQAGAGGGRVVGSIAAPAAPAAPTTGEPPRRGAGWARGAAVNATDAHGRTPLHVTTFARQRDAVRALVKAGADLNRFDNDRYDVVTIASVADDEETLRVLLQLGASAKQTTSRCDGTALIAAEHLGHDGVVRQLIAAGAPLDHVNNLH